MSIASKSLHCPENQAELKQQLFAAVNSQCVVTRDAYNRPTITGGTFQEMCDMNGYVTGVDRFWSTYFLIRIMAGQLSTIIGPPGVQSDSYIHIQDYSDQEYLDQYALFSDVTKAAMENFIAGFNRRIDELNNGQAPMPAQVLALTVEFGGQYYPYVPTHVTLLDFIRFGYHVTSDYSPQKIGLNGVLNGFGQIENLVAVGGYTLDDAKAIVSDLFNTNLQRANGIVADSADTQQLPCSLVLNEKSFVQLSASKTDVSSSKSKAKKQKEENNNNNVSGPKKQKLKEETITIADYLKKYNDITEFRRSKGVNCPTQDRLESFSFVVSGDKTDTNEAMVVVGPQINVSSIPGFEFNCDMINAELGFKHVVLGHLFGSMGVFGRNGYSYATSSVLGSLPGIAALLEDPSEDIFVRNATFQVRFGAPVTVPVYKSPYGGFVIQQGITSSLFSGPRSLVARNLDYGNEIQFFDTYFLAQFADSIDQLRDTMRGPGWSTGMDIFIHGADNQGHTFIGERAGWYDFGSSNIIPQGVLGEPIPDGSTIVKRTGYFVVDDPNGKGYSCEWNSAVVQQMPSVYGDSEISRVQWMEQAIEDIVSVRKFKESDIRDVLIKIGNAAQGPSPIGNSQEYWADVYHWLLKDRFTQAVQQYSNPTRSAAVVLLSTFDGGVVDGDVITSLDIQDGWMLAQQWVWEVQAALIQETFTNGSWANFAASSDKTQAVGTYYSNTILGLLARVLGVSSVQNALNYPDWALNAGDIDLLIAEALDRALSSLGGLESKPWGTNKRPVTNYTETFFGPLPFQCNTVPVANRSGIYMSAVFDQNNGVNIKSVCQIGQDETILFTPYPTILDTAQQCDYVQWNLLPLKSFVQD